MPAQQADEPRQPHAVLDLPSRRLKGEKIARILGLPRAGARYRLLEIGAGSGGISQYFASHPSGAFEVHAVDVHDMRLGATDYAFQQVSGTGLPFADASFDVVISNHVIEHVGDAAAQLHHLQELRRVLRDDGTGYLAVPNRWMLVEPHYRLAFLSWWPESMRSTYLRWMRGQPFYDCRPLTLGAARGLFSAAGLQAWHQSASAVRLMLELEPPRTALLRRVLNTIPDRVYDALAGINPTLIFALRKDAHGTP